MALHGFEMTLDVSDQAEEIQALVDTTSKQLAVAVHRAMIKAATWLKTHSIRELGAELGVKQEPLKQRFNIYPKKSAGEVRLWIGLEPIGVHRLGNPKVSREGVRVNSKEYEDAFIAPMKSKHALVFRRRGKERLPIDLVDEDIDKQAVEVIERWERRLMTRFKEILEHEAGAIANGYA